MRLILPLCLIVLAACGDRPEYAAPEAEPGAEAEAGWTVLFDGTSMDAFRGFGREDVPASWSIDDGALHFRRGRDNGDIMTRDQFGDFELEWQWRISQAGNSGVIYRSSEEFGAPYDTGVEYQILDNIEHPDAREGPDRLAGSVYDLYPADSMAVKAVGEWNDSRIVAHGDHVQHWLNGDMMAEYVIGSDDWNARYAESKWPNYPEFATTRSGHIAFQDHGDPVWYRNIRIR